MMIGEPEAILLDEPFSALDGYLKDVLQREMQDFLKDYPGDMILVTHSRDEAYKFCRELSIVHEGRILVTGETKQLFERPGLLEAAKLTGCKNFFQSGEAGTARDLCGGLENEAPYRRKRRYGYYPCRDPRPLDPPGIRAG